MTSLMRNQFLHTVGIHTTDLSCTEAVKWLFTWSCCDVGCDISLLPVGVRHVEIREHGCRHYYILFCGE